LAGLVLHSQTGWRVVPCGAQWTQWSLSASCNSGCSRISAFDCPLPAFSWIAVLSDSAQTFDSCLLQNVPSALLLAVAWKKMCLLSLFFLCFKPTICSVNVFPLQRVSKASIKWCCVALSVEVSIRAAKAGRGRDILIWVESLPWHCWCSSVSLLSKWKWLIWRGDDE